MPSVLKEKTPGALIAGGVRLYAHGYYYRTLRAKGWDVARKRLRIKFKRYKCRCCGKCFSQGCGHIGLLKWQQLNAAISQECASGVSNKKIAQKFHLSASTVERRLHRNHEKLPKEQLNYPCPVVLGIDEHSIHRSEPGGTSSP